MVIFSIKFSENLLETIEFNISNFSKIEFNSLSFNQKLNKYLTPNSNNFLIDDFCLLNVKKEHFNATLQIQKKLFEIQDFHHLSLCLISTVKDGCFYPCYFNYFNCENFVKVFSSVVLYFENILIDPRELSYCPLITLKYFF